MRHLLLVIAKNAEPILPALFNDLLRRPLGSQSEILFIDDASSDKTFSLVRDFFDQNKNLSGHSLRNTIPQGFGGNQKVGLRYAMDRGFDTVAVFYPQDRYSVLDLVQLLTEMETHPEIACVTGTDLIAGGTPQKVLLSRGHQVLAKTFHGILNLISGLHLYDWSASGRIYSVSALRKILFELNSPARQFDIEILLQLMDIHLSVIEKPIPSTHQPFYFAHTVSTLLNGIKVALRYRFQRYHLFYDIRYHPEFLTSNRASLQESSVYREKISMESPHTAVISDALLVPSGTHVLDVGCATGYVADILKKQKGCRVTGLDMLLPEAVSSQMDEYCQVNLETDHQKIQDLLRKNNFDVVIMLDVLEHLSFPELFLLNSFRIPMKKSPKFIFSTANVAFIVVRVLLFFGIFNYGTKGILDVTHKRLFTLRTFRNLMEQTGFIIVGKRYFPFPFAMLGLPGWLCGGLQNLNKILIQLSPSLFSYQILYETVPLMSPQRILEDVV